MTDIILNLIAAAIVVGLVFEHTPAFSILAQHYRWRNDEPSKFAFAAAIIVDLSCLAFVLWRIFA